MDHQVDHGKEDHGLAVLRQGLVVFGQATVLAEPGEGAFHDPALGQDDESPGRVSFHDLDNATAPAADPMQELPGIGAVGKDHLQPTQASAQVLEQQPGAIAVLEVGRMHHQRHDQPERVHDQMPLAAVDLLGGVEAAIPPFSAVLIDWLSRMPTEGVGFRPAFRRTWPRSRS